MTQPRKRKYDLTLLAALMALLVFGLIILYSTSAYNGEVKFHDSFYYLKKQVFATLLGILGMYLAARTDYRLWKYAALPGYLAALLLSVAVLFIGEEYNGSKRWLSLGPFFISAFGIRQGGGDPFPGLAGDQKRKEDGEHESPSWRHGFHPADRRPCRGKQFEHCHHHPGDRGDSCVCGQSQVHPFSSDGRRRSGIHGGIPGSGELPAGAAFDLARSGGL